MRMTTVIGYGYVIIAITFGVWLNAMDARYGVKFPAYSSWLATTVIAVGWPIGLPTAMLAAASDDGGGRWTMGCRK